MFTTRRKTGLFDAFPKKQRMGESPGEHLCKSTTGVSSGPEALEVSKEHPSWELCEEKTK